MKRVVLAIGYDPGAFDFALSHLMGFDPLEIGHIWASTKAGIARGSRLDWDECRSTYVSPIQAYAATFPSELHRLDGFQQPLDLQTGLGGSSTLHRRGGQQHHPKVNPGQQMGISSHFCPKSGWKTRSLPHISVDHGLVGAYRLGFADRRSASWDAV